MESSRLISGFIRAHRTRLTFSGTAVRAVHKTEIMRGDPPEQLSRFIAECLPFFYRDPSKIIETMHGGLFFHALREALGRLPNSPTFRESHLGEILAGIYAEGVLGLSMLYSKLSYLSSENSNAYKMDLVMCDFSSDQPQLVWGEVKSSMKAPRDGAPKHDVTCYASIFKSLREYTHKDRDFDITAVKDNLHKLPPENRTRLRDALQPYPGPNIRYAAFAVIDANTYTDDEASVLHTRANDKAFDVEIVGVDELSSVNHQAWLYLERLRRLL